jgi:hypothetical protein
VPGVAEATAGMLVGGRHVSFNSTIVSRCERVILHAGDGRELAFARAMPLRMKAYDTSGNAAKEGALKVILNNQASS